MKGFRGDASDHDLRLPMQRVRDLQAESSTTYTHLARHSLNRETRLL